jgi:peptidoglycan/xylan/chitin deacetylase (PgdA/CDA1 family)
MRRHLPWLALTVGLLAAAIAALGQASAPTPTLKPYRVLVVVDTWGDPASQVITDKDTFQPVAALLKAWSVPFDILRLDQQNLGAGYFFDRSGRARYGTVLWLADPASYAGKNLDILTVAVHSGTSVVFAVSRFAHPTLEDILGLKYKADYRAADPLVVAPAHFITRETPQQPSNEYGSRGIWVESRGAQVLIQQGRHPVVTVRQPSPNTAAVWIGAPNLRALRDSPYWRIVFLRSLVWSLGYLVLPDLDYSQCILVMIDDWGCADKAFLSYWRYQTVTEELMRERVIPVLAQYNAVATANVITGYVDRKTQRVIAPWGQNFTDIYGVQQDYSSTRRALKAAVDAGVLEIQSHGWTHMQPDLDSPPGPWWTADLEGEGSVGGWYEEFEDTRRGAEAPALTQLFHLKRSLEYLLEDFGARPLSIIIGGGGWSKSYANHSARLAAQAGFGLFDINERYFYIDRDLTLDMAGISPGATHQYDRELHPEKWPPHPDGPYVLLFHDRDISLQHDFVQRTFEALPKNTNTVSMSHYIAILHTGIESATEGTEFGFHYDEPYCAYFKNHPSSWRLLIADPLADRIGRAAAINVVVDGRVTRASTSDLRHRFLSIHLPAGMGRHTWKLEIQ